MTERVDCVVIGAGVVGLAIGRALAEAGREVIVLERHNAFGSETSSRNSEVIHAGIYYGAGTLKARFCVAGKKALYAYCRERNISHKNCGKLIVAISEAQVGRLDGIAERARRNGVDDLRPVSTDEAREMEPDVICAAGLLSPSTGVVDSHGFMLSLLGDLEAAGGALAFGASVDHGRVEDGGVRLHVGGAEEIDVLAKTVVNSAGLSAERVARSIEGLPPAFVPEMRYAKGQYFAYTGKSPFSHLIYPLPEDGGLGVHVTVDLGGAARLGPDVTWDVAPDDLEVDPERLSAFYDAAQTYWPGLERDRLRPDYAGIRPKLSAPGAAPADFRIDGPSEHGVDGLINLYGIESPGLTSSLAIADFVRQMVLDGV